MGNSNQNAKSSSNANSKQGIQRSPNSSPPRVDIQQKNDLVLRSESKLQNVELHNKRVATIQERENSVSDFKGITSLVEDDSQKQKILDLKQIEECIQFSLISERNEIDCTSPSTVVCGVQLLVRQPKEQRERVPMDLVCVIDDSGSMSGNKAQLVRKSLKYLLKIMNAEDRVSLISFDSEETILTPWLRNNAENKNELKKAIKQIKGKGSTNIEAGVEGGLWMLKNRKTKNPVSCMFLLSDGQDDSPFVSERVAKLIANYGVESTFIVNSYGYGADHDASAMRSIAETHKGGYYYIDNVKKVSEWLLLSISGLLSAVSEDIVIKIKQRNIQQTCIKISEVYGGDQLWVKHSQEKGDYEIYLPHLMIGDSKYFAFDIEFDSKKFQLTDATRHLLAFEAELECKAVKQENRIRKNFELFFTFKESSPFSNNSDQPFYEELMVTHSRAVGGMKIKQATDLISNKKDFEQAKNILQDFQESLKNNIISQNNTGMKHLNDDVIAAIGRCTPKLFRKASFEKMEVVHGQRRNSILHQEDWNEEQEDVMGQFKNNELCLSDDSCDDDSDDGAKKKNNRKRSISPPLKIKRKTSDIPQQVMVDFHNNDLSVSDHSLDDSEEETTKQNNQMQQISPQLSPQLNEAKLKSEIPQQDYLEDQTINKVISVPIPAQSANLKGISDHSNKKFLDEQSNSD